MTDKTSRPRGVFSAAATPLTADYAPDYPVFIEHCRHLLAEGCDGIAMLGTTGEANSFSMAERKALLEAVVVGGIDPARLLPGTGVAALTETVELTRHAAAQGVRFVVMLPPFYYKGVTEDGIFAAYSEVVERVGDARLRVILYHIPQMSAVPITHEVIARLLTRYPKTFVGIKDSSGDFANMEALAQRFPDFSVLAGADPLMLPLLRKRAARAASPRPRTSSPATSPSSSATPMIAPRRMRSSGPRLVSSRRATACRASRRFPRSRL
jgi:4-hydroxy-tetrahydrodipicolinate synthase